MSDRDDEDRWEAGGTPDEAVEGGGNRPEDLRKVDGRQDDTDAGPREPTAGPADAGDDDVAAAPQE